MANRTPIMLVEGEDKSAVSANAKEIVSGWLQQFEVAFAAKDTTALEGLFVSDSWLKDDLVFSWDTRAINGASNIVQYILQNGHTVDGLRISANPHFQPTLKEMGPTAWLESGVDFKTGVGRGRGIVRLANTSLGIWKGWIVFTALEELKDYPRQSMKAGGRNLKRREIEVEDGGAAPPVVVVIGGSSSGLAIAACLQDVGVKSLIIERSPRIGDAWRNRYKRLELHSPSYGDPRPFLDIPANWPTFPNKDQYADYLESYACIMNLDMWLETEFRGAHYDEKTSTWTVETTTAGGLKRTLHPRHIVWGAGAFISDKPVIPEFAGSSDFKGELYHAGKHYDAAMIPDVQSKKVVVIGSNTTAHDICQDFAEAGVDVTMIQRSSTIVVSPEATVQFAMPAPAPGQSNEDYIFGLRSFPTFVLLGIMEQLTPMMLQFDHEMLSGLDKTEFVYSKGENGDTFLRRGILTRGGFYVNHGASELIASNKIKVMHCPGGVEKLTDRGLVLADGREAEADIIVLATGWHQIEEALADVVGEEVAKRANLVNKAPAIDGEGQPPGIFRPSGHPAFWVAIGNLLGTNMNSLLLALQIQAKEVGSNKR